jgi:hypothetical protein
MDLADASLVALAQERRLRDILTLDRGDFSTYRLRRRQKLGCGRGRVAPGYVLQPLRCKERARLNVSQPLT